MDEYAYRNNYFAREYVVRGSSLPEAYHSALESLDDYGEMSYCIDQGKKSTQLECSMTIVVTDPLSEPMISKLIVGTPYDFERYIQEMLDGILDFRIGDGWEYTYHDRMVRFPNKDGFVDQYKFVLDELRSNPWSRRAVITFRSADDIRSDCSDPACLQHIQFFIRDGYLHAKALFRSNDAVKATFMNMFALIMLQKKIADELGVKVGSYTHRANSFHCYERDFSLLANYIHRLNWEDFLVYRYEGEWKELMDDEKETVDKLVESLRK